MGHLERSIIIIIFTNYIIKFMARNINEILLVVIFPAIKFKKNYSDAIAEYLSI